WNNKYEVTFLETSTNPQTGASDYARIVTDPKTKAIISNDTITTSAQLNTNSMLGYMMTVTTSNTQTTPSPYLKQVRILVQSELDQIKLHYDAPSQNTDYVRYSGGHVGKLNRY